MSQRILVTGMSGLIGAALRRRLEGRHELRALNRREVPDVPTHAADIADGEAIAPAFAGIDTVVHLAAIADLHADYDAVRRHNLDGTYHVFEAARAAGVRRVVYASSGAVVAGYEREEPFKALAEGRYDAVPERWPVLTHTDPVRPAGLYGCSKVWGEALARRYADAAAMSMLCVRIGHVTPGDRPESARDFSIWCSQDDIARLLEACIAAPPELGFDVFFGVSDNRWSYRDMSHPREVLGFTAQHRAEDYR